MKQKRKISMFIALAMLLTVFAVPSIAYGTSYDVGLKGASELPDYIPIGQKLDFDVKFTSTVNQSEWTWKVEEVDPYFEGDVSAIATIDENGVLTARGEGLVFIKAIKKPAVPDDEDDPYTLSCTLGIGFLYDDDYSDSRVRLYPNKTAKLMDGYVAGDSATYVVPTQYVIKNPEWTQSQSEFEEKHHGTYKITTIAPEAVSSKTAKKIIVPDTVTTIGNHALGYDIVKTWNPATNKDDKTYNKVAGVTIYGSSNNTAASRYAKANGFAYKNMDKGAAVKATTPKKVANVKAKAGKKQMTVTWKRDKNAKGYQITYAQKKNFKKAKNVAITKNKTTKKVIKKLKAGKKYYVKVRAYKKAGNKKVYGAYSKVKTVKIK